MELVHSVFTHLHKGYTIMSLLPFLRRLYKRLRKELAERQDSIAEKRQQVDEIAFAVAEQMYNIDLTRGASLGLTPEYEVYSIENDTLPYSPDSVMTIVDVDPNYDLAVVNLNGKHDAIPLRMAVDMREAYLAAFGGKI
jgi:hypothetical protein